MTTKKILAVSLVAVLCLSGYLALAQDDSSANADYLVHVELYKDGEMFSLWKTVKDAPDPSEEQFGQVVSIAVKEEDPSAVLIYIGGQFESIICKEKEYKESGTVGGECYGFINWYLDGVEWKQVTDDYSHTNVSVTFSRIYSEEQYNNLPDDQKKDYVQVNYDGETAYAHKVSELIPKEVKNLLIVGVVVFVLIILLIMALLIHSRNKRRASA